MNIYRNSYEFTTSYGEKCFELHHGNILDFDEKIDILVISAFTGNYVPVRGTLVGALLRQQDIDVSRLAQSPFIDMREEKGIWVSGKLKNRRFQYIVCVEFLGHPGAGTDGNMVRERICNLFICLEMLEKFAPDIETVAMPLIGTGSQGIPASMILSALFQYGSVSLKRCSSLRKVYVVEQKNEKIKAISDSMDQVLKREGHQIVNVFKDRESREILGQIEALLQELIRLRNRPKVNKTFAKLLDCIKQQEVRYLDLAILARRVLELMMNEINPQSARKSLYKKIEDFSRKQVAAGWIISYMHIIRILGNEQAHDDINQGKIPCEIMVTDQRIMLHCLEQILTFWIQYENRKHAPDSRENQEHAARI